MGGSVAKRGIGEACFIVLASESLNSSFMVFYEKTFVVKMSESRLGCLVFGIKRGFEGRVCFGVVAIKGLSLLEYCVWRLGKLEKRFIVKLVHCVGNKTMRLKKKLLSCTLVRL